MRLRKILRCSPLVGSLGVLRSAPVAPTDVCLCRIAMNWNGSTSTESVLPDSWQLEVRSSVTEGVRFCFSRPQLQLSAQRQIKALEAVIKENGIKLG